MKTKFNFKIDAMKIEMNGQTVETPQVDIQTEVETTVVELKDLYELKRVILKESPELIEEFVKGLAKVYQTTQKLNNEMYPPKDTGSSSENIGF